MSDSVVTVVPVKVVSRKPAKKPREAKLLGPHFFFDIVRLARGRRVRDLRMLYTFGMLLAMLILYMARFRWLTFFDLFFGGTQTMPTNELARFAERFVFSILFVQNLAVFLMTPIYLGSCITEEKERRSLELLFISRLTSHEIVLGKLFARMIHIAGVLLAGLPILSLIQLWGGVDMGMILLNFVNTFFNLLTVSCFSILVSVFMNRTLYAVMTIYGIMLLPLLICASFALSGMQSPFGFLQFQTETVALFAVLVSLHLAVSVGSAVMAILYLRRRNERPPRWYEPPRPRLTAARRIPQNTLERTIRKVRDFPVPPVTSTPLLWKEYYFAPRPNNHLAFWLLSTVFFFAPFGLGSLGGLIGATTHPGAPAEALQWVGNFSRSYAVVCALFYILWGSFRAASTLVRERQNKTLDELLTVPIDRTAILGYKWLGSALHGWIFAVYFAGVVLFGAMTTGMHIAGAIFLLGSVLVHAFFWTTLGLYFSVVCRTVLSAYMRLGLTLAFVIIGTALYAGIVDFRDNDVGGYFIACGLNPLASWWMLGFTSHDLYVHHVTKASVGGCLLGVLVYALLGLSLWLLAYGKFQRERYRHVE